jgi:hypothetical protein
MHVGVDKPRHDEVVLGIDELRGRVGLPEVRGGTDLYNQAIADGDTPVLNEREAIIMGDQPTVPDQQHLRCLRCWRILTLRSAVSIVYSYRKK